MPIVNNGTTMTTIKNNTTTIQTVVYHGTVVHTAGPVTADPTVGTPFCRAELNQLGMYDNNIKVNITNNDTAAVTVYINGSASGTLAAGATGTYPVANRVSIPYSYIVNVYAQASGKTASGTISRSGTITVCPIM